jgi:hypothetical protein
MAEALRVPYFRSFPMPMTRTRSFPHPFATPNNPKGRLYNDMTYVLFDHAVWRAIAARTNAFRKKELHLPPTSYEKLEVWKIPYLYSFSPSVVPSPLDWLDWIHCTGYWFLDNPQVRLIYIYIYKLLYIHILIIYYKNRQVGLLTQNSKSLSRHLTVGLSSTLDLDPSLYLIHSRSRV